MKKSGAADENIGGKKGLKGNSKKKKIIISCICVLLAAAIAAGGLIIYNGKSKASQAYSFVRTTTLAKGTLENSISATGTVESAKTSNVTSNLTYTVKSVNVSVGDKVSKGDVICTLDTDELEEQIEREQKNVDSSVEKAQSSYDSAKESYASAKSALSESETDLNSAKAALNSAKTPYTKAKNAVKSYQSAYDSALKNYNNAGAKYVKAASAYEKAISNYKKGKISASELLSAANAYCSALQSYSGSSAVGSYDISDESASSASSASKAGDSGVNTSSSGGSVTVSKTADDLCAQAADKVYSLCAKRVTYSSKTGALAKLVQKTTALQNAKTSANYYSLYSSYETAQSAYDTAEQAYEQAESSLTQAKSQLDEAKSQLESASESDTLTELKSQLDECTLKAEQDGTVTALNATVGSSVNESKTAVATISDLSSLKVSITIEEANINNAQIGMTCYITSDASSETINGTLSQIDPVAGDSGSFGAEITVTDSDTDLKVGMNASAELLVSSADDVYQVPIDAIGTNDSGSFVYRRTDGDGVDMNFEKVYVTTGEKNDYYIEISSDDLNEGDVIRSSSDLTQGIETTSSDSEEKSSSSLFGSLFGGGGGQTPDMSGGSAPNMNGGGNYGGSNSGGTPPQMPGGDN